LKTTWVEHHMGAAEYAATKSKDPQAQVGCVIVDQEMGTVLTAFNGFPRGVMDDLERYRDTELKLSLCVHAEANAVATAARNGVSLRGYTAVVTKHPCAQCTALLIQAGIAEIISPRMKLGSKWMDSNLLAIQMCREAGVQLTYHP
jgi:dCMP deaminase